MTCQEFVELVSAFLDGELDDDGTSRFLAHLTACDGCDRYLAQFRLTTTSLAESADLTADPLPPASRSAILDAYRRSHPT